MTISERESDPGFFSSSAIETSRSPNAVFCCSKLAPWFLFRRINIPETGKGRWEVGQDLLGSNDGDEDDEGGNGAEKDTLHSGVVGYDDFLSVPYDGFLQVCPAHRFDLRGCGRDHLLPRVVCQLVLIRLIGTMYISELICDTRERSTESGRAHLCEQNGDDTPRALHAELHTERAGYKPAEAGWNNPERDENSAQENENDDR